MICRPACGRALLANADRADRPQAVRVEDAQVEETTAGQSYVDDVGTVGGRSHGERSPCAFIDPFGCHRAGYGVLPWRVSVDPSGALRGPLRSAMCGRVSV